MAKKKSKKTGRKAPKKDKRSAVKKAPKKKGTKKASSRAKKKPKAKKTTRKKTSRQGKPTSKSMRAKAKKTKRPIRWRYDEEGNVVSFYVPMKHKTKAEQKKASKRMVAACSAGAYRQSVGPKRTCGYRGLAPSSKAGRGLAYARWGFPKSFMRNPSKTYGVKGLLVRTFKDDDGDWGFAVTMPDGTILAGGTEEPSEAVAAREGKAEARYQATMLQEEGRAMRNPSPRPLPRPTYTHAALQEADDLIAAGFPKKAYNRLRRMAVDKLSDKDRRDRYLLIKLAHLELLKKGPVGQFFSNPKGTTMLQWKKGDKLIYGNAYADLDDETLMTLTKIGQGRYEIEIIHHGHGHTHSRGGGVISAKSLAAAKKAAEKRFLEDSGAKFPGRTKKERANNPGRKKNPKPKVSMRSIMAKALK